MARRKYTLALGPTNNVPGHNLLFSYAFIRNWILLNRGDSVPMCAIEKKIFGDLGRLAWENFGFCRY